MAAHGKRRAFGQHFLVDQHIISKIVENTVKLIQETQPQRLIEIGPGKGAITKPLVDRLKNSSVQILLIEKDKKLAAPWAEKGLQVLATDFLETEDFLWIPQSPEPKMAIVSNLPYSSGTAILTRLANDPEKITGMILMFQAEVAHRLRAEPGTKDWGSLSIWIQNRWEVSPLCSVSPSSFSPPPEVRSEVVVLRPRSKPRIPVENEEIWQGLLKSCFAHRRKMLRSSIGKSAPLRNALELSKVDGTKRAEALEWDEWERLYRTLLLYS